MLFCGSTLRIYFIEQPVSTILILYGILELLGIFINSAGQPWTVCGKTSGNCRYLMWSELKEGAEYF